MFRERKIPSDHLLDILADRRPMLCGIYCRARDIGPVSEPGFRKSIFVSDRLSARTILRLNQAYCIGVGERAGFDDLLSSSDDMIRAVPLREDRDLQIQAVYHEDALSGAAEEFQDLLAKEMAAE